MPRPYRNVPKTGSTFCLSPRGGWRNKNNNTSKNRPSLFCQGFLPIFTEFIAIFQQNSLHKNWWKLENQFCAVELRWSSFSKKLRTFWVFVLFGQTIKLSWKGVLFTPFNLNLEKSWGFFSAQKRTERNEKNKIAALFFLDMQYKRGPKTLKLLLGQENREGIRKSGICPGTPEHCSYTGIFSRISKNGNPSRCPDARPLRPIPSSGERFK